jgi:hypothetical protein
MADPVLQSQFLQIVLLYILSATGTTPSGEVEKLLARLGPEAVPAVIEGINFVAANQIGTC